jgi:selenophosphate synthase
LRLLVDPQTSGGLIAGVPVARAAPCVEALRRLGFDAAEIGHTHCRARPGSGTLRDA